MNQQAQTDGGITVEMLYAMLHRSMRNTVILGVLAAAAVWIGSNWRNAAMLLIGAAVSAASVWEWQRLARIINARLDNQQAPAKSGLVVLFFMLRLLIFAAVIYGSLKVLHGSVLALVCGLALALITMLFEALKTLRQ